MKHIKPIRGLILSLMLTLSANIHAHDFEVAGIYYNILDDGESAEVTHEYYYSNSNNYKGEVTIPETVVYEETVYNVTAIGDWAFEQCVNLRSVFIPNSVTSIGMFAFNYCKSLSSVTIGNSVTSIGLAAFDGCTNLEDITSEATVPPTVDSRAFPGITTSEVTLYVPAKSVEAYKNAEVWKDFNIKAIAQTGVASVEKGTGVKVETVSNGVVVEGYTGTVCVYYANGALCKLFQAQGERVELALPSGMYFVKTGATTTKALVGE